MKIKQKFIDRKSIDENKKMFENQILPVDDVVNYTKYSIATIYNLTSQSLRPHRRKRGRVFFIPLKIENWSKEVNMRYEKLSKQKNIIKDLVSGEYQTLKKISVVEYEESFDSVRDAQLWRNTFNGEKSLVSQRTTSTIN